MLLLLLFVTIALSDKVTFIGTGFGNLVTAYRLLESGAYDAEDMYFFEKMDRVGGRAYTARGIFPTRAAVNIGAHKFVHPIHQVVSSVVFNVLNLSVRCYSPNDCSGSEEGDFYYLRNNYSYAGDLDTSDGLPYFFKKSEKWTNANDEPNPFFELLDLYPYVYTYLENLTSTNNQRRYNAIKDVMNITRTYQVNGKYPHQLSLKTTLNHTSEFWQYWVDQNGESINTYPLVNNNDVIRSLVYYALEEVDAVSKYVIVDSNGDEIGYSSICEGLAAKLVSMGVNITYLKEAVGVYNSSGSKVKVVFSDGTDIKTDNLVLGIAPKQVMELAHDSVIFSDPAVNDLYRFFSPICAVKVYLYYPKSWWLPVFNNEVSVTNDLRYFEYIDSASDGNVFNSGGFVNVAYVDGQDYCDIYQALQYNKSSPLVVIYANTTDQTQLTFFNYIKKQVRQTHDALANLTNITNIPKPEILIMGVWGEGWHNNPVSNYPGGSPSQMMLHPIPSLPVYFVNEAYSVDQGWAEGAGIAGEKVAVMLGAGARPSWLGNKWWYDAVITNYI